MFKQRFFTAFATLALAFSVTTAPFAEAAETKKSVRAPSNEEVYSESAEMNMAAPADSSCCADFRSGGGCWRKCDGKWKDLFPNEEYCRITDDSAKCRAEYRPGGGCWRRCKGFFTDKWKDQVDESYCQIRKCGSTATTPTPTPSPGGGGTVIPPSNGGTNGCCVDFRSGGGCWRKCDGKWKDLMPNESVCRDSDPNESCHAEYRSGGQGGCWRICNGKWKDKFPTELECQVRRCH